MTDYPEQSLQRSLEKIHSALTAVGQVIVELSARFRKYLDDNPHVLEGLRTLANAFNNLPERREVWVAAAQQGWYVTWPAAVILERTIVEDAAILDAFMTQHLRDFWKEMNEALVEAYPHRAEIIRCAVELHEDGRYIASIPLFLAQADGVCAEALGAHLFTDKDLRGQRLAELRGTEPDFFGLLIELLGVSTQISAGISKSSDSRKKMGPNRSGIMHGARGHLDYGTEINSLKAFGLLSFVSMVLSRRADGSGA